MIQQGGDDRSELKDVRIMVAHTADWYFQKAGLRGTARNIHAINVLTFTI